MSTTSKKGFENSEAELYLILEQVLKEMSESTRPQQKLADELVTLLQHHYEEYGRIRSDLDDNIDVNISTN